ncbi:MAG: glycosyltransferase family 4 protein [Acholeplasma sp.]|nr:glycosyltransferase family 4 protein [Acholeplasma sp.]
MRIGLFTDAYLPQISGVTTSIYMLAEGLRSLGNEVYIITTSGANTVEDPYIIRLKGMPIPKKGLKSFRIVPFTNAHIKKIHALNLDVMHVHTEFSIGSVAVHMRDKYEIPMVFTVHTMYEEYLHYVSKFLNKFFRRPLMHYLKKLMKRFIKRADVTITPTKKVMDLMRSYDIEGHYEIIPTGIQLDKFKRENYEPSKIEELKKSLGLENEFVYLFLGRISREKSIDVLLDAFAQVAHEQKSKFLIIGDGPAMSELKDKVKKLKIEDKVVFTGFIKWTEVGLYYQLGDVFINASVTETQGLTYIEALAASLPVIVKYDACLLDVIDEFNNGLFFRDDKELPLLMRQVYELEELRNKLIKNATKSIEKYSQECYSNSALKAYEYAIQMKKAS